MSDTDALYEGNSGFAINMAYALLIWLFGVLVFLPLAKIHTPGLYSIVAILLTLVFSYSFVKAARHSGPIIEYLSSEVSSWVIEWRSIKENNQSDTRSKMDKILKIILILISYLVFRPLLCAVNPVLAGIVFILVLLGMIKVV